MFTNILLWGFIIGLQLINVHPKSNKLIFSISESILSNKQKGIGEEEKNIPIQSTKFPKKFNSIYHSLSIWNREESQPRASAHYSLSSSQATGIDHSSCQKCDWKLTTSSPLLLQPFYSWNTANKGVLGWGTGRNIEFLHKFFGGVSQNKPALLILKVKYLTGRAVNCNTSVMCMQSVYILSVLSFSFSQPSPVVERISTSWAAAGHKRNNSRTQTRTQVSKPTRWHWVNHCASQFPYK